MVNRMTKISLASRLQSIIEESQDRSSIKSLEAGTTAETMEGGC